MDTFKSINDQEISDLLNFIYNSSGNTPQGEITPKEVSTLRD